MNPQAAPCHRPQTRKVAMAAATGMIRSVRIPAQRSALMTADRRMAIGQKR